MDISKWALRNRNLIYFLIAVLIVGGIYSAYDMSKLEDPEIKVKLAMVATTFPGASAHQVELEVTDVLEKEIRQMGDLESIESYSYNDLSLIQVELRSTVDDNDVEQCWDMLRRKVSNATASLPAGCGTPIVQDDFGSMYGMFYALTGDGLTDRELSDYAELIKRELMEMEDIDRVTLYGKRSECINISLLQDKMANLGVLAMEVLATLNGQNETTYSGYFEGGDSRIRVTVNDKFTNVTDIADMLIQGHEDDQLRLRDIALVEKAYEDPTRNEMFRDGERAIGILIAPASGTDIVKVGTEVEETLENIRQTRLPAGVVCEKVFFQPDRVSSALTTFFVNLVESVCIVVVILMIFMGLRSGLIIGASLVIIVLGSFLFLSFADGTMQRVSLATFILAMGMLVDNAIVIVDGILVDLKAGKPRQEALTAIGRQTAMPLLGATLIAIIAFLPIFLSPDTAGVYVRDLFIVLAVSLLLSWVLALVHVPLMADKGLKVKADASAATAIRREYPGRTYALLRRVLDYGLHHRWTMVFGMVGLLVLSLLGYQLLKQGFFPDMVYDQLYMEYKLPEGQNFTRVERDLKEIEAYLHTRPEVTHVTMSVGGTPGRYNLVRSIANPSLSYGELIVDFTSAKTLVNNLDEIQAYLTERYPDAYVKLKRYNLMYKKYPIEAQLRGPDPAVLQELGDQLRRTMEATPELSLITSNWDPRVPVLTVEYDQAAARLLGLSRSDVSMSLLTATGGIPVGSFYDGIHAHTIYVKCLDENGEPIEDLGNTQVFSSMPSVGGLLSEETIVAMQAGTLTREDLVTAIMGSTPLKQVCRSVDIRWEYPVVPRYNGQRSLRMQCSPAPGVETEAARTALVENMADFQLPEGYMLDWQGEKKASDQSMKYLFKNFPFAIILMIAILITLFGDYRKPTIIFCSIPFIIVGVVIVILLTGKVFNFVAIVGTLGLIGMLIKNGIVLMDEINLQLSRGIEPVQALIDSAQSRLRPVMMASLTTVLGMIPLLSDAMFGSMAAAIMGGLLFGTIITLVFVPVLYALFFHIEAK